MSGRSNSSSLATVPRIKPAKVLHELDVRHVSELGVVLKGVFDRLALHWAHADVAYLPILNQMTVGAVLELDYLVHVARRRRCSVLTALVPALACRGTRLQLGLLSPLVSLAVVVRDSKYFFQVFRRHESLL